MSESDDPKVQLPPSKVITPDQIDHQERLPDFTYEILVKPEDGYGFSLIRGHVLPGGESKPKKMLQVTRSYTIIDGKGSFWLDGKESEALTGGVFVVSPGSTYSFKAGVVGMEVFEVNKFEEGYVVGTPMYEKVEPK